MLATAAVALIFVHAKFTLSTEMTRMIDNDNITQNHCTNSGNGTLSATVYVQNLTHKDIIYFTKY